jgi:DNA-binding Lrp family transcriptional regulator
MKVRTRDAKSLGRLLRERIGSTGTVQSTRTTIVLETVRESRQLPLGAPREAVAEMAGEEVLDE